MDFSALYPFPSVSSLTSTSVLTIAIGMLSTLSRYSKVSYTIVMIKAVDIFLLSVSCTN